MPAILYIGSDNSVLLDGLQNSTTESYVNSGATVTFTLYRLLCKDGVSTASDATFTAASAPFVSGDAGRKVVILGAGGTGADLRTTIATYTNTGSVELTASPSVSLTSVEARISVANATTVTMSYVTSSNGDYRGTLDDSVELVNGALYWIEISADAGSDVIDLRVIECIAQYRRDQ